MVQMAVLILVLIVIAIVITFTVIVTAMVVNVVVTAVHRDDFHFFDRKAILQWSGLNPVLSR